MILNRPHGGRLVNRILEGPARDEWLTRASSLPRVRLNARQLADVEMIAVGAFSPLEGFMNSRDYASVLREERLSNGVVWTIPVTLAVSEETARGLRGSEAVALTSPEDHLIAALELEEVFTFDREKEALSVLLSTSDAHPGVAYLKCAGDHCLAGRIHLLERPEHGPFENYRLDPKETRYLFSHHGWKTVVAFQTRNPVHLAHEYILKCALETVDGLLLHPLIGDTRDEDVPAEVRLRCYLALLGTSLPVSRIVFSVYPAAMRYAGPREAIFHAIARKNYGCTHFIVGRDHAGVGGFYGPFDAQKKFFTFASDELGITPLCFDATFYCKLCARVASEKTCPHGPENRLVLSGTKVRELLRNGSDLPPEFTRPEVAAILREAYREKRVENR
ncbi:MAG TPA: sulfate adenylyltransferase [Candidatus Acidoferrum sp.]|nr:sulfate adenylyltransferase [Candidatus Acidoferrum sp.]